jgi:flagellar basal-body rod protein FlgB
MDYTNYQLLTRALDASSLRQDAVSHNIANINTPGYKAQRVEFENLLHQAMSGNGMSRTDDRHYGQNGIGDLSPQIVRREGTSIRDDGNNVDIDLEMSELAANNIYYQSLTNQLSAKYAMVRSVLR